MASGYVMELDICRWRLAGEFLTTRGPVRAAEVVRVLGAVQSQDYSGAKWALAQRTRAGTDATVEREIDAGDILRTHVLRPTWHFVVPADIRWMLALTGPRISAAMAPANRRLELDRDVYRRTRRVFEKALAGTCLTRAELKDHLERSGVATGTVQRLAHLMMQAELDAVICSGPRRGKQFTYALLDERVPTAPSLERDEALAELTRRYFTTRSPATPRDFAWWSGLTVADAKRGIDLMGPSLERVTLGDVHYWIASDRRLPRRSESAHLLPNYDEYFVGFRDRRSIAQRIGCMSSVMGASALVPHVIIVDGELVGIWKRTLGRTSVALMLQYQTRVTPAERERVVAAAQGFGKFLGLPVELENGRTVRP
jgi:hypothetical protein